MIRSRSVPAPDAITDNYSITEDQLLVGSANGFLNNDSDPDGDPLSIILIDGLPFSFGTPITLASGANLTINADGSFQYDQNGRFTYLSAGQTVNDIFTYTISDGRFGFDTSAVCVTISGVTQSHPPPNSVPQVVATTNLTVDEDGFAFAANDALTARNDETASTGLLTQSGTAVVNFGNDVPTTLSTSIALVDTPALDGQLHTHDGQSVVFALSGGDLVGTVSAGATEVIRIHITGASLTNAATGEVSYTYSTTLSQPIEHASGNNSE